jgi:hypothetical protein
MNAPLKDDYAFWRACLANPGQQQPIEQNTLMCGYWRMDERGKVPVPVAIFRHTDGKLYVNVGKGADRRIASDNEALRIWQWLGKPIAYEEYRRVAEEGQDWSDIDPGVAKIIENRSNGAAPGIGHNNPPDEFAMLKAEIESAKERVQPYAKITSPDQVAGARTVQALLNELGLRGEKRYKAIIAPAEVIIKEARATWLAVAKEAREFSARVRMAIEAFETEQLNARRAAEAAAEAARRAAEESARKAAAAAEFNEVEAPTAPPEPALPLPSPPLAEAPQQIRGAYGRAASRQVVKAITDVTDWTALFAYFQADADVQALLRKKATQAVNAGQTVPGVVVDEVVRIK